MIVGIRSVFGYFILDTSRGSIFTPLTPELPLSLNVFSKCTNSFVNLHVQTEILNIEILRMGRSKRLISQIKEYHSGISGITEL